MRASSLRRRTRLTWAAMTELGGGFGSKRREKISRSCGTVKAGIFSPQPAFLQFQEPQGQQRQGHVVMPAHPTAHLIMAQSHIPFAGRKQLLGSVPLAVDGQQLG